MYFFLKFSFLFSRETEVAESQREESRRREGRGREEFVYEREKKSKLLILGLGLRETIPISLYLLAIFLEFSLSRRYLDVWYWINVKSPLLFY